MILCFFFVLFCLFCLFFFFFFIFFFFFFFFFQAEDGIRDGTVTGVQTCALPIYPVPLQRRLVVRRHDRTPVLCDPRRPGQFLHQWRGPQHLAVRPVEHIKERSEEHTSELQSQFHLVCRLLLEKKKNNINLLLYFI